MLFIDRTFRSVRSCGLLPALVSMNCATMYAADSAGLIAEYYQLSHAPKEFPTLAPDVQPCLLRVDKAINFDEVQGDFYKSKRDNNFYVRWRGNLVISTPGDYVFSTESNDGSRLSISGTVVVENRHVLSSRLSMDKKSGIITLLAGEYPIMVEMFQGGGGAGNVETCRRWFTSDARIKSS
jgi:PA14 domain